MSALAGVLCPPRKACLLSPNLSPTWLCLSPWLCLASGFVSQFSLPHLFPIWLCLSPWLGCCVRLAGLVSCLPICLPICLSPWLGCCVRLAGLVSQFVSHLALSPSFLSRFVPHLALSFTLAGMPVGLSPVSQFVFQFVSQFVSHLALSPSFVSPFVPHLALSFTLAGVLSPPRWACPVLSPNLSPIWLCLPVLSPHLFPIWLCLSPWLGRRVRLLGLVSQFVS